MAKNKDKNQKPVHGPSQDSIPDQAPITDQSQSNSLGSGPGQMSGNQDQLPNNPQNQDQSPDNSQNQDQPPDNSQNQDQPPSNPQRQQKSGQKNNEKPQEVVLTEHDQLLMSFAMNLRRQKIEYDTVHIPDFTVQTSQGDVKYSEILRNAPQGAINALSNEARKAIAEATADLVAKLRFLDDELFRAAMEGQKHIVQAMLRNITGDPNLTIATMHLQKDYYFPGQYHSCMPDVYCETTDGRIIIIELQKQEKSEDAARASFLAHVASFASLKANHPYNEMKNVYVIFLADIDVYGTGEFIHWIRDPEVFPKSVRTSQPRHTPQTHKIFVNCMYGFEAVNNKKKLLSLRAEVARETDNTKKAELTSQIDECIKNQNNLNKQLRRETSRYGLTAKDWRSALGWTHDLCSAQPEEIDQPALANLMRLVKKPDSEGVNAMSAIVYEAMQKVSAQVREQERLDFAAKLLADGYDNAFIHRYTNLTDSQIQDLRSRVTT